MAGFPQELTAEEYTVEMEHEKTLFKESVAVTVSYEGCSCSFKVFEK